MNNNGPKSGKAEDENDFSKTPTRLRDPDDKNFLHENDDGYYSSYEDELEDEEEDLDAEDSTELMAADRMSHWVSNMNLLLLQYIEIKLVS